VVQAAQIESERNLKYVLAAQKFCGITAEIPEPGRLKISFETTNQGNLSIMFMNKS